MIIASAMGLDQTHTAPGPGGVVTWATGRTPLRSASAPPIDSIVVGFVDRFDYAVCRAIVIDGLAAGWKEVVVVHDEKSARAQFRI